MHSALNPRLWHQIRYCMLFQVSVVNTAAQTKTKTNQNIPLERYFKHSPVEFYSRAMAGDSTASVSRTVIII